MPSKTKPVTFGGALAKAVVEAATRLAAALGPQPVLQTHSRACQAGPAPLIAGTA